MNAPLLQPLPWSPGRWWGAFFLVMVAQVGLIFCLSDRRPIVPRQSDSSSSFGLVADGPPGSAAAELLAVNDPTLLALPHPRGFSGAAWMQVPPRHYQSQDWSEPQRWLTLQVSDLGAASAEFVRTNPAGPRLLADKPPPRRSAVAVAPVPVLANSTFRIEGDLAGRDLLTSLEVPSFAHTDILSNTVVQVCVGPLGFTFSTVVISSSGSRNADQRALELAKSARFRPEPAATSSSAPGSNALTCGRILFQWHTLEMPATDNPAGKP